MVILELTKIPGKRMTSKTMAKAIGIPLEDCERAIHHLEQLKLITVETDGSLKRETEVSITTSVPNETIMGYGEQLLDLAKKSIRHTPSSERAVGSKIFPMNAKQFKLLQERLYNLLHEIMLEGMEASEAKMYDSVYLVSAQIVPLASIK